MPIVIANPATVSTPWNVSGASYDSVSLYIGGIETDARGSYFKPDGTKLYMVGFNDRVYPYTMSTAWDLSSATYDNVSFLQGDDGPQGVYFSNDGTRMYIAGTSQDKIFQYTLSTPWLVTSASFVNSRLISGVDTSINDLWFKPDGTKMYMIGAQNDFVYELDLNTAWDITTLTDNGVRLSVAGQNGNMGGMFIKDDGTQMFISGNAVNQKVFQYTFATPWDLSTLSYDTVSYSTATEDNAPVDVFFKSDGSKMYILGIENDSFYQYSL